MADKNQHVVYDNFYLSNEIDDQFDTHLNLQQFCTVDNSLVGTAGMERKINVYSAIARDKYTAASEEGKLAHTDWEADTNDRATEKLDIGSGNTKSILVQYAPETYRIMMGQNKFSYYDEQEMTDPMLVPVGVQHMGTDLFNFVNYYIFKEFEKTTLSVETDAFDFGAFADAVATLNIDGTDNDPSQVAPQCFAFVNPKDMASVRKNLKDDLKYVESFSRTGYVGTVAGVNLYTKKDAEAGKIYVATREAITLFNKKGVEVEQNREPDTRCNTIFARKYFLAAMTDKTKAVKITLKSAENVSASMVDSAKAGTAKAK